MPAPVSATDVRPGRCRRAASWSSSGTMLIAPPGGCVVLTTRLQQGRLELAESVRAVRPPASRSRLSSPPSPTFARVAVLALGDHRVDPVIFRVSAPAAGEGQQVLGQLLAVPGRALGRLQHALAPLVVVGIGSSTSSAPMITAQWWR